MSARIRMHQTRSVLSQAVLLLAMLLLPIVCTPRTTLAQPAKEAPQDALRAIDGDWIFVEDRTEGRTLEQLGSPMATKFSMRFVDGAVILNGHGSGHKDVRVALDGTATELPDSGKIARYSGAWKKTEAGDGAFEYEVAFVRPEGEVGSGIQSIRRTFRPTAEGLIVTVTVHRDEMSVSTALYRHAQDIPMPAMAKATAADLAWLAGDWVGTRSSGSSIEERWSPPLGGSMLAVSRTFNTSGKLVGFEYLRVVERDGSLVYVAQPGGKTATEFVLTELTPTRAVFDNPRHDYPKRIVYELSAEGVLSATTGYLKGGTPRRFEFRREASERRDAPTTTPA